ncbi:MAG: DUF4282 domain-containing protein [Actinobacteria bacterium]|nr:DUF4282 domain-containing protein [Actinomycetota bacterium]
MADVLRTCANCGNSQATGDFCEKCGTRMPAVTTTAAAAGAAAAQSAAQAPHPPSYGTQPPQQYAPPPPEYGAPQYAYARESGYWGHLFDFSFQGFVTRRSIKTLYTIVLGLIAAYVVLSIVILAFGANRWSVVNFLIALVLAALYIFWSRILFELIASVLRLNERS